MLLNSLPHTATAKKRKRTSDGMGGFVDTYTEVVFTDKECWQQPVGDQSVSWWSQRGVDITHKVYFNEDPGLDENCVLIIDDWMLDVKSYAEPDCSVGLAVLWRVMTQRIGRFQET